MTADYISTELAYATTQRDQARARMNASKAGSKKWRDAEEDLNFWQGKVANLEAAKAAA